MKPSWTVQKSTEKEFLHIVITCYGSWQWGTGSLSLSLALSLSLSLAPSTQRTNKVGHIFVAQKFMFYPISGGRFFEDSFKKALHTE